MYVESHDLENEFPNQRQVIETLRTTNPRFATLFAEYNDINSKVVDLEQKDVPTDDFTFEDLKKRRLRLKDEIYSILNQAR